MFCFFLLICFLMKRLPPRSTLTDTLCPDTTLFRSKLVELAKARALEQALLPLTAGLDDIPALPVTPDQARLLRQGQKAIGIAAQPGLYLATDQSVPVADRKSTRLNSSH